MYPISRIAFIGLGLIGGSLARCLRGTGHVGEVVAHTRSTHTLETALKLGVIDRGADSVAQAVDGAQVVVLATPVRSMPAIFKTLTAAMPADSVVTDVGSVKRYIVDAAREHMGDRFPRFVPAHPIAGTERSGVAASFAELYRDKSVILTPLPETAVDAVKVVDEMWRACGAITQLMAVDEHDRLLAVVSHLPHVVAYATVDYVAQSDNADTLFALAAAGFYDFTRIASSDPVMWRDVCLTNGPAIGNALRTYRVVLDRIIGAIEAGDDDALESCFERAKNARDTGLAGKKNQGRERFSS